MKNTIQEQQYLLLKTLCDLWNGSDFVSEDNIRKAWPDCPSHDAILNMGVNVFFDRNPDVLVRAYMPTADGIALVRQREQVMALQELRQEFDQYRADEAAYKTAQEHRTKIAERKNIIISLIVAIASAVISGMILQNWPNILAVLVSIVH